MTDLPALREAVAKMTPGPWEYDTETHGVYNAEVGYGIVDAEPKDAAGIVALRNAAPALLDEVERVRAEHEYQLCEAQRWAGRAEQAEAEVAALKAAPCPCCGAMAEDYVEGRCLDVDNDPGVFTSGEPHD